MLSTYLSDSIEKYFLGLAGETLIPKGTWIAPLLGVSIIIILIPNSFNYHALNGSKLEQ